MISAVSYYQLRSHSIALSAMHPGAQTMLFNLLHCTNAKPSCFTQESQQEYVNGLNYEIYRTRIPYNAAGLSLGQFQLDMREYGMLFVAFCDPCKNLETAQTKSGRHLGVPLDTILDEDDTIWMLATSWKAVVEFAAGYTPNPASSTINAFIATAVISQHAAEQDVLSPRSRLRRRLSEHELPAAGITPPNCQLQLKTAGTILHGLAGQPGLTAEFKAGVQTVVDQLEGLEGLVPMGSDLTGFSIVICAFQFEESLVGLVKALVVCHGCNPNSIAIVVEEMLSDQMMIQISNEMPQIAVRIMPLSTIQALRQANIARADRIVLVRPHSTDMNAHDNMMLTATRISNLVFAQGQRGKSLVVEVPRGSTNISSYLGHHPYCDHDSDPVTLHSMDSYDNLDNQKFRRHLKRQSINGPRGEDFGVMQYFLSYEHASGSSVCESLNDMFILHSVIQPSLVWLLSALLGMPNWLRYSPSDVRASMHDLSLIHI
eukprot:TRINITY_DN23432_c0_g1_i1.p1 TRINITY_DN23432_c0_g1~~TRINITY_DN23432_c0_g1_i1.p1  ORF type:complete len:487 (+),score=111.18 TRINITY_DN23432_c0_g1_i1:138-1598(+)